MLFSTLLAINSVSIFSFIAGFNIATIEILVDTEGCVNFKAIYCDTHML